MSNNKRPKQDQRPQMAADTTQVDMEVEQPNVPDRWDEPSVQPGAAARAAAGSTRIQDQKESDVRPPTPEHVKRARAWRARVQAEREVVEEQKVAERVLAPRQSEVKKPRREEYDPKEITWAPKKARTVTIEVPVDISFAEAEGVARRLFQESRQRAHESADSLREVIEIEAQRVADDSRITAADLEMRRVLGAPDNQARDAVSGSMSSDLLAALYANTGGAGPVTAASLIPAGISRNQRRERRMRFVAGSEIIRVELTAAIESLLGAFESRQSSNRPRPAAMKASVEFWTKQINLNTMDEVEKLLKADRSSLHFDAASHALHQSTSKPPPTVNVHMLATVPHPDPGLWPFDIDFENVIREPTQLQHKFTVSGVDPAFLDAVKLVVRSYANIMARSPGNPAALTLQETLPLMSTYLSGAVLSSGSIDTYSKRLVKWFSVSTLSNQMITYNFSFSPRSMESAFHETMTRLAQCRQRHGADLHLVVPKHTVRFADLDASRYWDHFFTQYDDPLLPGFGWAWIKQAGLPEEAVQNVVHYMDAATLLFEGVTTNAGEDVPDPLVSAIHWCNQHVDRAVEMSKEMATTMSRPSTWKFNMNSSAGPLFDRKPNSQAYRSVLRFWRSACHLFIRPGAERAFPSEAFLKAAIQTFDAKEKNEILPASGGKPTKSRIICSGTLDLPQAAFLGLFPKRKNYLTSKSLAGINLGTNGGLHRLMYQIHEFLGAPNAPSHVAVAFRDNVYIAVRVPDVEGTEQALNAVKLGMLMLGDEVSDNKLADFQWQDLDITSMEACHKARLGEEFWKQFFDRYERWCSANGYAGMAPAVRDLMEKCIEARKDVNLTYGPTTTLRGVVPSGVPDTGERNQAFSQLAEFVINECQSDLTASFNASFKDGSQSNYWQEYLTEIDGNLGVLRYPAEVVAAFEMFGMLAKVEGVVGSTRLGGLATTAYLNNDLYLPIDLLGYGTVPTFGSSGAMYYTPMLAPGRLWPAMAFNKQAALLGGTAMQRMALARSAKATSLMLNGGWKDLTTRQVLLNMMISAAGIMSGATYDPTMVEEVLQSVLENTEIAPETSTIAQMVASVVQAKSFGLNWVIDAVFGEAVVADLADEYGELYVATEMLKVKERVVPMELLSRHTRFYQAVAPQEPRRERYAPGPAHSGPSDATAMTEALRVMKNVIRDEDMRLNLRVPDTWVMPDPRRVGARPRNYRPLAVAVIFENLPAREKAKMSYAAWFKALHALEQDSRVRYSLEPRSVAALESRSSPDNLPLDRSTTGFLTHPTKKALRRAEQVESGWYGLVTEAERDEFGREREEFELDETDFLE